MSRKPPTNPRVHTFSHYVKSYLVKLELRAESTGKHKQKKPQPKQQQKQAG